MPNAGASFGTGGVNYVKTLIRSTDEEWKVVGPLLQSVSSARATANYSFADAQGGWMGGPGGGFGRGGPGGPGGFGRGGPGGGDSFADPGMGRGGPGDFGRGGRGGRGGFGRGGPGGGDSFGDPGMGRGGPGGFGRGGFGPGPDGFGPGMDGFGPGGPPAGLASPGGSGEVAGITNAPGSAPGTSTQNVSAGGPSGGSPSGMGGAENDVATALSELRTAASTNAAPEQLKEKIEALSKARQKAKTELTAAEKKLRQLLTAEQQSVLTALGYLD